VSAHHLVIYSITLVSAHHLVIYSITLVSAHHLVCKQAPLVTIIKLYTLYFILCALDLLG